MGQSGTWKSPVMISVTTLSTLLGVYLGSEISDNMFDEKEVMNVSMNTNNQTTWSLKDEEQRSCNNNYRRKHNE